MKVVADASVTIAWLFAANADEPGGDSALELFEASGTGLIELMQPPHWIAETVAVAVRKDPSRTEAVIAILKALGVETEATADILVRAADLANRLNHHLFDTLYHAVALETGATLVTADDRYFAKARSQGHIVLLRDFQYPPESPATTT